MRLSRISLLTTVLVVACLFQQSCRKIPDSSDNNNGSIFNDCIESGDTQSFEIVTINLQGFPKAGDETFTVVKDLIYKIDPDLIALQEVASETEFFNLIDELNNWDGRFYPVDESPWNLAYMYKTSEVEIDNTKTRLILTGDSYAFPRPPFEIYITHKLLNISSYAINIHLKCCGGTENEERRRDASEKLDNYIKTERPNDPVIILGDYNDIISSDTPSTNVFYNLVSSSSDYLFTDLYIAEGSSVYWSYPQYPSHIDHTLVTNELFLNVDTTMVLRPDVCYLNYFVNISDHRPVELILE